MDAVFRLIYSLALAFLLITAGAAAVHFDVAPGPLLKRAFEGGQAAAELYKFVQEHKKFRTHLWVDATRPDKGVITHLPDAYDGYTLYASTHAHAAQLIDMDGNVVHEWALPYSKLEAAKLRAQDRSVDYYVYWRKLYLLPDGELLIAYSTARVTPWGYGLIKLDKDSNLLWAYDEQVHHDLDVAADGRIVVPIHWIADEPPKGLEHLTPPIIEDGLAILSPEGKELQRISLTEAFRNSAYAPWLDRMIDREKGDITHNNNAEWSPDGMILVSFREMNLIATIDPVSESVTWATQGPWVAQHDPDFLEDGKILLFDNLGHSGPEGRSRLLEFDPLSQAVTWMYTGFDNDIRGSQQKLGNGNVLVTDSQNGRIFEVTRAGDVVWEYINPERGGEGEKFIPVICSALRYTKEELTFLGD